MNVGKSKIMRFKRSGRRKKIRWRWEGKEIEEVREYKYLGYVFQSNGEQERQVRERMKRGMAVMGQVWGIGKRRFGGEWGKRIWLLMYWFGRWWHMGWKYRDGRKGKR